MDGAWDLPAYEFSRDRFCEHTSDAVVARFRRLTASAIEELKSYPALFAYEGTKHDARVGYIRRIKERGKSVLVEYEFEEGISPISYEGLARLLVQLDIDRWEMTRTHWAIKDEDLFEILHAAHLTDESFSSESGQPGRVEEVRFKVALSFPGERREYVRAVATELKRRLPSGTVFYDKDFSAQLARPNLDTLLQRIYLNNSDLVVVFLCADYERKQWCGLEWRAIREIIKNRSDHSVMFMRFDDSAIQGMLSIDGYIDVSQHTPIQAAGLVLERVRLNDLDSNGT